MTTGAAPRLWGRKLNGYLAIGLAVLVAGLFLYVGISSGLAPELLLLLPLTTVLWLYALGGILLVERAVLAWRSRHEAVPIHPALPFVFERFSTRRDLWIGLALFVALVTLVREGLPGTGPLFSITLEHSSQHASNDSTRQSSGGRFAPFTVCSKECSGAHGLCEGFRDTLRCSADSNDAHPPQVTHLDVELTQHGLACLYTPLVKTGSVSWEATTTATGNGFGSVHQTGAVERTSIGFSSCESYNREIGRQIALDVARSLRDLLR